MISLSFASFIKQINLTEAATGITNELWARIMEHIQDGNSWRERLIASAKWNSLAIDPELTRIISEYFREILTSSGFTLDSCVCEFYKTDDANGLYGHAIFNIMNASNTIKKTTEIKVRIGIEVFRMLETDISQLLRGLYHELIHIEQGIKVIKNLGIPKLSETLTPFVWTPVNRVINKVDSFKDAVEYVNDRDEVEAYARDLSLQLFYKYKPDFKLMNPKQQDFFIRTAIIPNIKNEFSPEIRNNVLDNLSDSKTKHKFYILLIKQLTEFATSVALNV